MAESDQDDSQKTEEPTARKLEDARKRGQVVLSREINSWVILFTAALLLAMAVPSALSNLRDILIAFIARPQDMPTDARGIMLVARELLLQVGGALMLPFLFLVVAAIAAPLLQIGPLFSAEPLKPNLSKISLIKGMQRLFSSRSLMEFVKGLIKLGIVSAVGIAILMPYFDTVEHFVGLDFGQGLFELHMLSLKLLAGVLAVLFVVAVLDYLYQRHEHMKNLRMSKQEIRDEFKQSEGDPHVKAKLRQLREAKARQRMIQAVPEADVVITNPTHYAVALKYTGAMMAAPMMLAKGVDRSAEKIREVAKEHNVPIVENAPLARALFDSMEVDEMIPQEHYKAVAEVISYVFKLKNKR